MTTIYTPESRVWVTSDLHLNHAKPFIWASRGFNSTDEMNKFIIKNLQKIITEPTDELYILGDVILGETDLELLYQIPGHVHVILGNHDTDTRERIYRDLGWIVSYGERIKYTDGTKKGTLSFLLTHYPTITSNPGDRIDQCVINLSGHTHSDFCYNSAYPFIYNVGCDASGCLPRSLSYIANFMKEQIKILYNN